MNFCDGLICFYLCRRKIAKYAFCDHQLVSMAR